MTPKRLENIIISLQNDKSEKPDINVNRQSIKDDCKILSQITNRQIEGYITEDKKSFNSIINPVLMEDFPEKIYFSNKKNTS